ncbi:MAG: DNA polymerase III subunit gamma/tau [Puniceicoccales bacterium]|nr:DNA polymerase III subunit gamma/tau [Puniceicoccales bacterium]
MARRWRPKALDDVVGQEHVLQTLRNALKSGRIAHAYLFVGPRGTGKTTMARLLAMALNCSNGPASKFDCDEPICRDIWRGEDLDVMEIDGASHNSVEEVRELRESCIYAPTRGRYRIYILDEVHMLSNAAFNALLKVIEEPPTHVKFIFATTEVAKVPPTILSRCQCFHFRPISTDLIAKKLAQIAETEGIVAEKNALVAIGRLARGSMRDAQTSFEQLLTYFGKTLREDDVLEMYGLPKDSEIAELELALLARDSECALAIAERWNDAGIDLSGALQNLQEVLHKRLIAESQDRSTLHALLQTLQRWGQILPYSSSERADFAVALLEAIENSRCRPISAILKQLHR